MIIISKAVTGAMAVQAVVTATIRYLFEFDSICNSTALRPFDDLRYDRRPGCGLLHCGLNENNNSA